MFNQFCRVSKIFKPPTHPLPHVLNDGSLTLVHAELMVYVPTFPQYQFEERLVIGSRAVIKRGMCKQLYIT